jgi:hypothetical protein
MILVSSILCILASVRSTLATTASDLSNEHRAGVLVHLVEDIDSVTSRMVAEHARIAPGMRAFCKYFRDLPAPTRQDELGLRIFLTTGFCTLEPVLDEHERLLSNLRENIFGSAVAGLPDLHKVLYVQGRLWKNFPVAVDIQDFAAKVDEVFPVLRVNLRKMKKSGAIAAKVSEFEKEFTGSHAFWVQAVADLTKIMTELGTVDDEIRTEGTALLQPLLTRRSESN